MVLGGGAVSYERGTSVQVSCGANYTAITCRDGALYVLGDGDTTVRPVRPARIRPEVRLGDRKGTAGIIGLWQPSVHSDVAFCSVDVGSRGALWG